MTEPKKNGRKPWIPPDPKVVEKLAMQGLTDKQICNVLGISHDTFYKKRRQFSDFSDAIDRGRDKGIAIVSGKLLQLAQAGDMRAIERYLKSVAKWQDHSVVELKNFDPTKLTTEELERIVAAATEHQADHP